MKTKTQKTKNTQRAGRDTKRDTKTAEFLTIYKSLTPAHRRVADALVVMLTVGIDAEKAKAAATEMGKMWCKEEKRKDGAK